MNHFRNVFSRPIGRTCAVGLLLLLGTAGLRAQDTVYYVPDDYPTIQQAIDATGSGDTVVVRAGTYVERIQIRNKGITLRSESGASATTIDGNNGGAVVRLDNGFGTVVEGFRITRGRLGNGAGVTCTLGSATLRDNVITGNAAVGGGARGGGVLVLQATVTLVDNVISGNTATKDGGGLLLDTGAVVTMTGNRVVGNSAGHSGGMRTDLHDSITLVGNRFENNRTTGGAISDHGGGVFVETDYSSTTVLEGNVFLDNTADGNGGGLAFFGRGPAFPQTIRIVNNVFAGNGATNKGGGVYFSWIYHDAKVADNTLFGNSAGYRGGGMDFMAAGATPALTNMIFWGNTASLGAAIGVDSSATPPAVTYSDVQGGWSGTGNINADPQLVETAAGDFHLTWGSPCRNVGDNSLAGIPTEDFEGDPRIHDGTVDLGADEFHPHLYAIGNISAGASISIRVVGTPGTTPVTLGLGAFLRGTPVNTQYGKLWLGNPIQQFSVNDVPANGVLLVPATIPNGWQPGKDHPVQALLGPQQPGSVLTNLLNLKIR